jgi:hypothetical protein
MLRTFEFRIENVEQARLLLRPLFILRLGIKRVSIAPDVVGLSEQRRSITEDRLNQHLQACGCGAGALVLGVVVSYWVCVAIVGIWPSTSWIGNALVVVVSLLAGSAVGRWIGRVRAILRATEIARTTFGKSMNPSTKGSHDDSPPG